MKIHQITPATSDEYDAFVQNHPDRMLYYGSKYGGFIADLLGCTKHYLIASSEGRIEGVLPLMKSSPDTTGRYVLNALPFYGSHGAPLGSPEAQEALIAQYNTLAAGPDVLSATMISHPTADAPHALPTHNMTDERISQITPLPPLSSSREEIEEAVMSLIDSSARRNVRKAAKSGISVEIDNSALAPLTTLHKENMAEIGGLAKDDRFFELVPEHFVPGEDFNVYVARYEGDMIAGLLLLYDGTMVEYFTPATKSEFRNSQPLALILLTAMADAVQKGFTAWNWGGTWTTQDGVYRFKHKWGARDHKYAYYTQLNDMGVQTWEKEKILSDFPNFYVLPFSQLQNKDGVS